MKIDGQPIKKEARGCATDHQDSEEEEISFVLSLDHSFNIESRLQDTC
jgi:hypothetical protein